MSAVIYVSWADNTGYAIAAKAYIKLLMEHGISVNWQPMKPTTKGYKLNSDIEPKCELLQLALADKGEYDTVILHMVPEYFPDLMIGMANLL